MLSHSWVKEVSIARNLQLMFHFVPLRKSTQTGDKNQQSRVGRMDNMAFVSFPVMGVESMVLSYQHVFYHQTIPSFFSFILIFETES